jgi:hypothetical protein
VNERHLEPHGGDSRPEEGAVVRELLERAGPLPPIPDDDLAALTAAARRAWQKGWPAPRPRARPESYWALAAALAMALGAVTWWGWLRGEPTVARVDTVRGAVRLRAPGEGWRSLAASDELRAGTWLESDAAGGGPADTGGTVALRLAEGVDLRLDAGSRLQILGPRTLHLAGGALYVDTGGPAGPVPSIEVRTLLGVARDIGTRFSLRLELSDEPTLRVQVRDGAVAVDSGDRRQVTEAGKEGLLLGDGTRHIQELAPYGPEWDWVLGAAAAFDVEGRTLAEFLTWVRHETGWRIDYADEEVEADASGIVLHGGIGDMRPDRAPFALLPGAGLEGRLEGGRLVIARR